MKAKSFNAEVAKNCNDRRGRRGKRTQSSVSLCVLCGSFQLLFRLPLRPSAVVAVLCDLCGQALVVVSRKSLPRWHLVAIAVIITKPDCTRTGVCKPLDMEHLLHLLAANCNGDEVVARSDKRRLATTTG